MCMTIHMCAYITKHENTDFEHDNWENCTTYISKIQNEKVLDSVKIKQFHLIKNIIKIVAIRLMRKESIYYFFLFRAEYRAYHF